MLLLALKTDGKKNSLHLQYKTYWRINSIQSKKNGTKGSSLNTPTALHMLTCTQTLVTPLITQKDTRERVDSLFSWTSSCNQRTCEASQEMYLGWGWWLGLMCIQTESNRGCGILSLKIMFRLKTYKMQIKCNLIQITICIDKPFVHQVKLQNAPWHHIEIVFPDI